FGFAHTLILHPLPARPKITHPLGVRKSYRNCWRPRHAPGPLTGQGERVMAILQLILTSIFRSLGKILNTAFGWATALLFGKVPEKRQIYLSVIAFASILWLVVLLGVVFPRFAAF